MSYEIRSQTLRYHQGGFRIRNYRPSCATSTSVLLRNLRNMSRTNLHRELQRNDTDGILVICHINPLYKNDMVVTLPTLKGRVV